MEQKPGPSKPAAPSTAAPRVQNPALGLQLSKVKRRIIAVGEYGRVACAVDASMASPADTFLGELKDGYWDDPEVDELPDKRQVKEYYRFLALCKKLADGDEFEDWTSYNRLGVEGIWELKVGIMRLTFYDTDGLGHWTPKLGDRTQDYDGKPKWLIPLDFDFHIRLANSFPKLADKAPPEEILRAQQIRDEDVNHDRDI